MKTWRFISGTLGVFLGPTFFLVLLLIPSWPSSVNAADLSSFSVFSTNSAWIRYRASVNSGDIGAEDASSGPWLSSHSEVTIGLNTYVADGISIYADSLKIRTGGSIFDAYYNELNNNGTIRGDTYTPLTLPLDVTLPEFPTPAPGTDDYNIPQGDTLTLDPGAYGKIRVRRNATLVLTGGTYHIENLDLGLLGGSKVLFQAPTDLIINKRLESGPSAVIGPADGSGISAKDIRIYVNGINGCSGGLYALPKAAQVGFNNILEANIYAPNGTIWIRPGTVADGAFIGKDVRIGINVQVNLNAAFGEPQASISASPETILLGESATLSWTSTYADTCIIEPGIGAVDPNGSSIVSPTQTTTYTITATGPCGSVTDTVTVTVLYPPTASISASPETILLGESATLSWTSTHADTCTIEPDIGTVDPNGSTIVSPTETTTYTITATGPCGSVTDTVTVTVLYPPTVSISVDPEVILLGDSSTLAWSSTHADTCVIEPDVGTVDPNGSTTVSPIGTITYFITATGPGGTATDTATITVLYPPTVTIIAEPESIVLGNSSTLTWNSTNTDTCTIEPGIGTVDPSGSTTVSPTETTTYTITATGPGGAASHTVTVTVHYIPTVTIFADPETILLGESSTLTWSSTHADTCEILPDVGTVDPNDATTVSPTETTTYTITATGPGGSATDTMTVTVLHPPTVTFSADPESIIIGESSTLTWTSNNADTCTIEPDIGTVDPSGSTAVSPTETTTYTFTATGPGGSTTASVTVNVNPPPLSVSISSPSDGQEFTQEPITVTGTVSLSGATVSVNGIEASVVENEFMAEDVPLTVGSNTITAVAEDGTYTVEDTITVFLMDIDLGLSQLQFTSLTQDPQSLKFSGELAATVLNDGTGDVTAPYHMVLFEDIDHNGAYEAASDNLLEGISIASGPAAQGAMDVSMAFVGELRFRDNPVYLFVDSANDLEETDETNNLLSSRPDGNDVSASLLTFDDTACPDLVTLTVRIGNSGGTVVDAGVSVAFYDGDPNTDGVLIGAVPTTQSLDPGHYEDLTFEWANASSGIMNIYAQVDDDGAGTGVLDEVDEENNLVVSEMGICAAPPSPGPGGISGIVMDAVTGALLAGADVSLHQEEDGEPGALVSQYTTGDYGWFVFSGLDPGSYILKASADGYITADRAFVLASGQTLTNQNLVLSSVLGPEEIRIVLTWGETPEDLEAHLTAPNPEGCRHHCYYWNRDIPDANLDRDDRESYGPETITITQRASGTYRYYVHDFINRVSVTSQALSLSTAHVKVYFGSGADPLDFAVPPQAGTVWHVFNLDGDTGEVSPVNRMTFQDDPGEIDFPVIRSVAVRNAIWGEPYTYEVEAEDPDLDILTYSLSEAPAGMAVDPTTGLIQWTPSGGQGGEHHVALGVTDGRCGEDIQTFWIDVTYVPVVLFSVEPCSGFNPGGDITLSWSTERAETVTISHGIGEVSSTGSLTIPSPESPTLYTLTAANGAGQAQRTVPQMPSITFFSASPMSIPPPGGITTLTWESQCAGSCEIQGIGPVALSGSLDVTVDETTSITLTATNGTGPVNRTLTILVSQPFCTQPEVTFTSTPLCEWSPGDPVTLGWHTQNPTCTSSCEIDQGIGQVEPNGSLGVTPTEPTTYTLTATGPVGSTVKTVQVPNLLPLSINSFNASPYRLRPGESAILIWSTQCANTCTLDQGIGDVDTSGTLTVTPADLPITYTLTAIDGSGSITKSTTINHSAPSATFSVSPGGTIKPGETATLTWSTEYATACTIEPDIGDVALSGSMIVQPEQTTTYTLRAQGPGGTTSRSVTVRYVVPTAQILADPEAVVLGQSSTLSWVFSNADTCTIDQGIGEVQLGETVVVTPTEATTYIITAVGPGGTATDSVTVTLLHPPSIALLQPDGLSDTADKVFLIKWSDEDIDSNASISLYYYEHVGEGGGGSEILIVSGLDEDPDGPGSDEYAWDTTAIPEGEYYVYAVIDDGVFDPIEDHSSGLVTVVHGLLDEVKITGTDAAENDYFGQSVSISGDYAIVGAPYDDDAGTSSGSAYVFKREGTDWIEQAKLAVSDAAAYDYFGSSVSISGDYVIVAATGDDDGGDSSGSAYIFKRDGTSWTEQAKLTASDAAAYDQFGYSLAISGDYAIVGGPYDDDSGSAYIFKRDGTIWSEQAKLTASDAAEYDSFGYSVSISGDYAIVGAHWDEDSGYESGVAYIFNREGSIWTEQAKLAASDASIGDHFGISVSISGDYAIVGKDVNYDWGEAGLPSAYVFKRDGSDWIEQAILARSGDPEWDSFGQSVAICGDYAIVGAYDYYNADQGSETGAAYMFKREGSEWIEQTKYVARDAMEYDNFGYSVSISEAYAIVGADGDDDGGSSSGSAYIYPYFTVAFSADPALIEVGESSTLSWSSSLANSCSIEPDIGDVDIIGSINVSPSETTTYTLTAIGPDGIASKSVTVVVIDPSVQPTVTLNADFETIPTGESCTLSWTSTNASSCIIEPGVGSVNISGSVTVTPGEDTTYTITASNSSGTATDSVTVVVAPSITIIEPDGIDDVAHTSFVIQWEDADNDDDAAISLYYSAYGVGQGGTLIATGLSEDPDGEGNDDYLWNTTDMPEGEYYVFGVIDDGKNDPIVDYGEGLVTISHRLTSEVKLTASDAAESDNFGYSVCVSGDYTIVGAPYDDDSGSASGSAYIFKSDGPVFTEQAKLTASDGASSDNFGISVSMNGDYAIVGAYGDDDSGSGSGSAYIFKREGTDWIEQAKLTASDGASSDNFGISVSVSGDYAIVGAYQEDDGGYNAGAAYIFKREGTDWIEQAKLTASDGASYDSFGYSVSISGDYAIVGAYQEDDSGSNSGAVYVFKREGTVWTEQAKLTAGDAAASDYFGYSVSIGEDYAIVGAYQDDDGGSNSGSAYVFKREGTDWVEQAKLTAGDAAASDYFGRSVSIGEDYAIVGAYGDDDGGSSSGAAYIFIPEGTDWGEQAKLTAGDAAASDYFGYSVSIGENYAAVGAHQDDDSGSSSGSVYVYPFFTLSFSADPELIEVGESCTLSWSSSLADSCSIEPDIGNVGLSGSISVSPSETTTYTITAVGPDGTASKSATVVVIDPSLPPSVTLSADSETILTGESCILSWTSTNASSCVVEPDVGSVDLNGSITVTPGENTTYTITAAHSGGTATDSVTVIVTPSITIVEPDGIDDLAHSSYVIQWEDADNDDDAMISLYYDIDDSGQDGTLIVSGLSEDPDGEGDDEYPWDTTAIPEGEYYVYAVIDDGKNDPTVQYSQGVVTIAHSLSSEVKLTASDGATSDYLGISVSIGGDYAIVGAYQGDGGVSNTGSAYVFKRDGPVLTEQAKLTASDGAYQDYFGYSVSISGDYAIVGAYGDDDGGSYSGAAYVFKREGSDWVEQAKLTASDGAASDYFGRFVSISGDYAIVGAYRDDDHGTDSGSAYVFVREGTDWVEQAKLTAADAEGSDYFGRSVAISGDYAIVGAYQDDDDGSSSGSAYVFKREGTAWTEQAKLTAGDAAEDDCFGRSVSISADYTIVGAYKDDDAGTDSGSAYVFRREGTDWVEEAKLIASDTGASDYFGMSVSISGDHTIVGAYKDDDNGTDSGSAYVFKRNGTDWIEEEKLTASDAEEGDYFGRAVAITWDAAIVGAYRDDDNGSQSGSAYIYPVMGAPALTVSISADPESIVAGESSTLIWTSENADTCSIEPDIGAVDLSGSTTVSPAETTTYTITATGPLGTVTDSVTVTVTYPAPAVSMSADPESIETGDTATLTWDSTYADSCVIDQGIGSVDLSGSITVSPSETTTYTITATGPGGSATESVTVTVIYPPTVSMSADPDIIQIGDTTTLTWDSENADTCEIDQGIGSVDLSGSTTVSPTETATYTISATGPLSTATDSVTVTVTDPIPTVSISADPSSIQPGESSTLSWTSRNADSCTIEPDIGSVAVNGSIAVSPAETTTYIISVTGLGLTASSEVRIFVGDGNVYSYGDPTAAEQAHLEALNRARLDPSAEAARLGIDLNEGLPEGTISTTPVQPLTFNAQLHQAAQLHSQDMIDQQYYGHYSLDGRSPSDRAAEAGYPSPVGENIAMRTDYVPMDEVDVLLHFHDILFIDEGYEGRGHRINILYDTYKEVGLAAAWGTCDEYPYCYKFTCDFSPSSHQPNAFLLGLVYDDQNSDSIYTAGEGIENVEIVILQSGAHTTTASAGGYGLALPPGYYAVEATLPDGRQVTHELTMTGQNVKLDFLLSEFEFVFPTVLINANPAFIQPGNSATLTWSSSHAITATIDNGIGHVPANGSVSVSPLETTTYTVTASGPGGTVSDSITVFVGDDISDPPSVSMTATPSSIGLGGVSTLSWSSTYGVSAYIDQGVGEVALNGSMSVFPVHTTTYTITVTNPSGTASATAQVAVIGNPAPLPEGSFGETYENLIPVDATIDEYDPRRFSIITGLVHSIDGFALSDVSITILGHPEYGTALTDIGGRFSIPVEGGATMTVVYEKQGLITAHRKVDVPWNDIAIAETIQMIAEDPISTTVVFDGSPDTVVTHRSSEVNDEFGSRACSMVFTGDNRAYSVDKHGNDIQELTTITTRATEFTTPESMPAKLPPNSAYTYCVELSVDNTERVRFDNPIITWIDNFLGFDVGFVVPVGYYDRDIGVWVPSDDSVVVKLLDTDTDGIVDALDADGDDLPDDLDNDGSFSNEVMGLDDPARYVPGSTFWRTEVAHFTTYDHNCPSRSSDGEYPRLGGEASADEQNYDPCRRATGSYLEDRTRIFHEEIPIPGTDLLLHYASNRVDGYKRVITVPASGETVPEGLKSIVVDVEVAGRTFNTNFPPLPNQIAEFVWDGLDYLGNPVTSAIVVAVFVGYSYDSVYCEAGDYENAFGQPGKEMTDIPTREFDIWWNRNGLLLSMNKGNMAEGWTLSNHHQLSPLDPSTLYKGDGTKLGKEISTIDTIAGDGTAGYAGDGGPATDAWLFYAADVAVDAEGNLYIADFLNHRIRRVDTECIITTVAGTGEQGYSGDGGPATDAMFAGPAEVAVDAEGNLYIADFFNNCIRKVSRMGFVTTVAGTGIQGYSGDGGPATGAMLAGPAGVAVDAHGNLYIADELNHLVRKVDTEGIISTVAGEFGFSYYDGDGGPAIESSLSSPSGVAVDGSGNLYIADHNNERVRKVDKSGIITTVAGNGTYGFDGDGGPATDAMLARPSYVVLDDSGNLYVADKHNDCIRKVDRSGIITTVAGDHRIRGYSGDGGPAIAAGFDSPLGLAIDHTGALFIADYMNSAIRKVTPYAGDTETGDFIFSEENGRGHEMNSAGRHQSTFDLATGTILYDFEYAVYNEGEEDEDELLVSITDRFDDQITIQRNSKGVPLWIRSPDEITTTLTIDANNHLTRITYPDGSFVFEYTPDGLMTAKIDPEGNRFDREFDENGRLTDARDQEGGHWQQTRTVHTNGDILAEVTTGEGNVTSYLDHTDSTGKYTSTIADPTGGETLFTESADGLTVDKSLPCGMDLDFEYDVEPKYRLKYVSKVSETTPSGLERVTFRNKTYLPADLEAPPELAAETVTVNGKGTTSENNVSQSLKTITSPEGRTVTIGYNPNTLLTSKVSVPGLHDTDYGYDDRGRLTSITTNARETSFSYTPQGFLESVTDPEDHTTTYTHDAVGRVTETSRPDGYSVGFTYDKNGNMTVLTNPSTIDHGFEYNKVNLNSSYQTPLSGSYTYVYDNDRRLVQTNFPSGAQINNIYSTTRLMQIQTPEGNIDLTYACGTKVGSITNGTDTITYGYDGKLLTSEALSGILSQSLLYDYNNDFNLQSFTYAGDTCSYTYDDDGLLTGAGAYTISRNAQNGLPEAVILYGEEEPILHLSRAFNGYGELDGQGFAINASSLTSWDLTRDDIGRVTAKNETVEGVTSDYAYTYDSTGRLLTVTKDSTLVEEYDYDANGARIYEMNSLRGISGRTFDYSDEDHLLTAGDTTYQYDVDGFLTTKTQGTDVTIYDYSSRGELLGVSLPDTTVIEYIHDPLGRRIAKKVDDVIIEKYLWQGLTRLLAVYDGGDNLIMRFEYADGRMPVAVTKDGFTYYLTCDQVGSLKVVADESGNVVKRIEYDSFGNIINDTNPSFDIPLGFAGGLHDRDTGLVRFGFRDYDPGIGRWTAKDPILFAGGDTDLYGYCLNDPISSIDPLGLEFEIAPSDVVATGVSQALVTVLKETGMIATKAATTTLSGFMFVVGELALPHSTSKSADLPPSIQGGIQADIEYLEFQERIQKLHRQLDEIRDRYNLVEPCP